MALVVTVNELKRGRLQEMNTPPREGPSDSISSQLTTCPYCTGVLDVSPSGCHKICAKCGRIVIVERFENSPE